MVDKSLNRQTGVFYLSKWYLDFVGDSGEAMIFYSAKLKWHGLPVSYTSWLKYSPDKGVNVKSRYYHVAVPGIDNRTITWQDKGWKVSGIWEAEENLIQATLFDSPDGGLEWICYQPASKVQLKIGDTILNGRGYAEQLILTVPPWKIPMDELRWGRFGSANRNMVWIELKEIGKKQWLWINGERAGECQISNNRIWVQEKNLELKLDQKIILEAEKKIGTVVDRLIRYIPGFGRVVPLKFIMADEYKWYSTGRIIINGKSDDVGSAIHELVNFKPAAP